MNRDTYKIIGILSSVIVIFISTLYFINSFNIIGFSQFSFFSYILRSIHISALFFIFYSASQLIKEFSPVNIDKLTFSYLVIEIIFLFSAYMTGSMYSVSYFPVIYTILYIALYIILATIAIQLLKVKKSEINIIHFKVFVLSYLIIILILNTTDWILVRNVITLNIEISEINNMLSKINYITVIPLVFALIFFIKQIQSKEHVIK